MTAMPDWEQFVRDRLSLEGIEKTREERIVAELAQQLEDFYREARARGLSEGEAEAFAQRQVQDWNCFESDIRRAEHLHSRPATERWADRADERSQRKGGWVMIWTDLLHDIAYGARLLRKSPGFTAVAVLTLALGIGAVTTLFSLVNSAILHPLPLPGADRLVLPWKENPQVRYSLTFFTVTELETLLTQSQTLEQIEAFDQGQVIVTGGEEPERVSFARISEGMFGFLGVVPGLGRPFLPPDFEPGAEKVVVLDYDRWRTSFGADPDVLGRELHLDGVAYTVVGVLPRGFDFPWRRFGYYLPLQLDFTTEEGRNKDITLLARRRPEFSLTQAQAEMDVLSERLDMSRYGTEGWTVQLKSPSVFISPNFRSALLILLGAGAFVMVIACANVANLLLARMAGRRRELAVRCAVGAGRFRIFRQIITETLLLSGLGGLGGLLLSLWAVRLISALRPDEIYELAQVRMDTRALLFSFAAAVFSGLLFGLLPAWRSARLELHEALKESGRSPGRLATPGWLRNGLGVTEVALSLVLLLGANLLIKSFLNLTGKDLGFRADNLLSVKLTLDPKRYPNEASRAAFFESVRETLAQPDDVEWVLVAQGLPPGLFHMVSALSLTDRELAEDEVSQILSGGWVQPGYFRRLGIPLLEGRRFEDLKPSEFDSAAIINRAMEQRFWPGESAVGKKFMFGKENWRRVVGVIGELDAAGVGMDPISNYQLFWPTGRWTQDAGVLILKSPTRPDALATRIKAAVWSLDANQPVGAIQTVQDLVDRALVKQRFYLSVMTSFAVLALTLALVGLYGVLSYTTAQRTHEIGIRMALGASRVSVLRMVAGNGFRLALLGTGLGLAAAVALSRVLERFLWGISSTDITLYGLTALVMGVFSLIACVLPARRATRVDPMVALRYE